MSWEFLSLILFVSIIAMIPLLLPLIKKIKISGVELELVEAEYQRLSESTIK